ncbi:hypothetical protein RYX36_027816 [Vicia faba]
MVSPKNIGKYRLGRTIGEGTFSKVKLAFIGNNGEKVAIKVIDKNMVLKNNLKYKVQSEIRTMKLLHHPNIVRIHEVIGTKTKIYIVMEYVSGGQLLDKMSYVGKLNECEARKLFQQLVDAVDYCHNKGVFHRDLKPENLLLDSQGNLKVSDFGLSALSKPNDVLNTRCGSPCYVAPELLMSKGYDGAAADVWSCGVILFELLAGFLPFDDQNLMRLYHKICRAEYVCAPWFTQSQKKLITKILEPHPDKVETQELEKTTKSTITKSSSFINAFQLIAMFQDLDLSAIFEEQDHKKQIKMFGSQHTISETVEKIEAAATDVRLSVMKMNKFKMKMHPKPTLTRSSRSYFDLSAEVIEVAPAHCVVQISKSAGDLRMYNEFCESLSSLLKEKSSTPSHDQDSVDQRKVSSIEKKDDECYAKPNCEDFCGYNSA